MAAKRKTCSRCGGTFPLTAKHWYLYEYAAIHKPCESARQKAKNAKHVRASR